MNPMLPGQTAPATLPDLLARIRTPVPNPDGGLSTVFSEFSEFPQGNVLYPRVRDGRILSSDEAVDAYRRTGEHMGIFSDPAAAEKMAQLVHEDQMNESAITQLLRSLKF